MIRLMTACCNCGRILGRSAQGAQTALRCPKCGAEIEYTVGKDTVTVRLVSLSAKQALRMKKYQERLSGQEHPYNN